MHTHNIIELLLENELKGLRTNCTVASDCTYQSSTNKIIIQCELHRVNDDTGILLPCVAERSLCTNCDKVDTCRLPGKYTGIWHCEEYE